MINGGGFGGVNGLMGGINPQMLQSLMPQSGSRGGGFGGFGQPNMMQQQIPQFGMDRMQQQGGFTGGGQRNPMDLLNMQNPFTGGGMGQPQTQLPMGQMPQIQGGPAGMQRGPIMPQGGFMGQGPMKAPTGNTGPMKPQAQSAGRGGYTGMGGPAQKAQKAGY